MNDALSVQFHSPAQSRPQILLPGLFALLLYASVWGSLCSMSYLAGQGVLALSAGAVAAALGAVLPKRGRAWLLLACLLLAALLTVLQLPQVSGGAALLLNRMFAASEAQNPYLYEMLPAQGVGTDAIAAALLPLGLVSAPLFALGGRSRLIGSLICGALLLWMAYLGVSSATVWVVLLAATALLPFFSGDGVRIGKPLLLGIGAALALTVLLVFPGQDPALHTWSEDARDALSLQTLAYGELPQEQPQETQAAPSIPPAPQTPLEPTSIDPHTLTVILAIAATLLLLFVPAILSDRLRKRRALLRAGLDDPTHAVCIRASFLYAMRWLQLAGLPAENLPYSRRADAVSARFPRLDASYRTAVPLWQAAAYGKTPCSAVQRQQMQAFLKEAKAAALEQMTLSQRLRSKLL